MSRRLFEFRRVFAAAPRSICLLLAWLLACPSNAWAHKPSDSYLSLVDDAGQLSGQWDLAVRDLDYALGFDADNNGLITWKEIKASRESIEHYARDRLRFRAAGEVLELQFGELMIDEHTDGMYVVAPFRVLGEVAGKTFIVEYGALFDLDPLHRGLIKYESAGQTQTAVFSPDDSTKVFHRVPVSRLGQALEFVRHGIWHIWIGYDHILFLLTMLLPSIALRSETGWTINPHLRSALFGIFKTVTAFTVAHSITLAVATLGWVSLPSRWVESVIAASIVVAALLVLFPRIRTEGWVVAFAFGLIHGFGFASVLGDLGLRGASMLAGLASFNIGVEIGQLAVVAAFLPVLAWLRKHPFGYRRARVIGSVVIAAIAVIWTVERAFDVRVVTL